MPEEITPNLSPEEEKRLEVRLKDRLLLFLAILVLGYMAIWGWGVTKTDHCQAFFTMWVVLALLIPIMFVFYSLLILTYKLMKGEARFVGALFLEIRGLIARAYANAPTLLVVVVLLVGANIYSQHYRYKTFWHRSGYTVYDKLLGHSVFIADVDCPPDYSQQDDGP